jgi:hypothetical protein
MIGIWSFMTGRHEAFSSIAGGHADYAHRPSVGAVRFRTPREPAVRAANRRGLVEKLEASITNMSLPFFTV